MIQKRKTPWGLFGIVLVFALIFAYYVSGLFVLEGVSIQNYQEKLLFIFMHPFKNWMNERTAGVMGVVFILWLLFISYYLTWMRDFHPDAEHGVAEWGDIEKVDKKLRDKDSGRNTYVSKKLAIGFDALSNMNMLILGGSGSGKTLSELVPNILRAAEMEMTNIILDIKGDLLKKYGGYLKERGLTVKALNFKNPSESDRYNPFRYISNYSDMIGLITNIQTSVKPPDAMKGDPFWDDGVGLYLQALFEYEWLEAEKQGRAATMPGILKLVNMETTRIDEEGTTALQEAMYGLQSRYGEEYPPVRDYRKLKEGASETVRSIVIMVNAQLRLFEVPEISRIFEDDDIDIPSLGLGVDGNPDKKTVLFLVMRSGDVSYNLFINMFYTQLFRVLRDIADNRLNGMLPIHVRLWADEFYAGPKPADCEMLLGEIRSRNMSIVPILQDIAQIKTLYPNDKWEIFTGNCAMMVYLGSGATAHTTHQWISDMLEDMTIDTRSEHLGHSHSNSDQQMGKGGIKLMTPGQVARMPKNDCILFIEGARPLYDKKNWPFQMEQFKEAQRIAGKNGYKNPVYVEYNEKTMKFTTTRFSSRLNYITEEEFAFYEEKAKNDSSIQTFRIDEDAFLYLNFNEIPQPSLRELEKMVRELSCREVSEEDSSIPPEMEEKEQKEKADVPEAEEEKRENWDLSGDILDCFQRYAKFMDVGEQEEIIKGIEEGLSDEAIKRYFIIYGAEKMRQYRRVLTARQ